MKKGSSLDYLDSAGAPSQRFLADNVGKSASYHALNQIAVSSPPVRSPSLSPLCTRRGSELQNHRQDKAMVQLGSPVQFPLLAAQGRELPGLPPVPMQRSQGTKTPPYIVPKPTPRSSKPVRPMLHHIYAEPQKVIEAAPKQSVDEPVYSKPVSIKDIVQDKQLRFPLKVRVYGGFLGSTDQETFSEGDILNFHFVKQTKVVVLRQGGRRVKVMMRSPIQFGVLHDPENNINGACAGYNYQSANQLMAETKLPKIVCACEAFKGSGPESTLEEDELLLIDGIRSSGSGEKSLHCTSLSTGSQKKLPANCLASFTTRPEKIKLYLPDILKHMPLPLDAVAFIPQSTALKNYGQPPFEDQSVVNIVKCHKETTIIAKPFLSNTEEASYESIQEDPSDLDIPVLDIPIDLPLMKVQIEQEGANERLMQETRELYESYTSGKMHQHILLSTEQDSTQYYYAVRTDRKESAFTLLKPEAAYSMKQSPETDPLQGNSEDYLAMHSASIHNSREEQSISSTESPKGESHIYMSPPRSHNAPSPSFPRKIPPAKASNIYDTPPSRPQTGSADAFNIYQSPRSVSDSPESSLSALTRPTNPGNIYQVPRNALVLQMAEQDATDGHEETTKRSGGRYVAVNFGAATSPPSESPTTSPVSPVDSMSDSIRSARQQQHQISSLTNDISSVKIELQRVQSRNQELYTTIQVLQSTVQGLRSELELMKQDGGSSPSNTEVRNRKHLTTFSHEKVLLLLAALGISENTLFKKKVITGDVLGACDDDVLKTELNIKSKLQRIKLIELIRGSQKIWELVQNKQPSLRQ